MSYRANTEKHNMIYVMYVMEQKVTLYVTKITATIFMAILWITDSDHIHHIGVNNPVSSIGIRNNSVLLFLIVYENKARKTNLGFRHVSHAHYIILYKTKITLSED
jgi:hypothetical protein